MTNITRRVMQVSKRHTFSFGDKEYSVDDLIDFVKDKRVVELPAAFGVDYLRSTDVNKVWGHYSDRTKKEIPVSLYDLIDHMERIKEANCRYPIIILESKGGDRVLDGIHRILKAQTNSSIRLKGVLLTQSDMDEFISRY